MDIHSSLYEGQLIRLGPIDHEKDPEVESRWTHDAEYLRLLDTTPARPTSAAQMKKRYEAIEKNIEEQKNFFYFTIRLRSDDEQNDRLVGFIKLSEIEWTHAVGQVRLGIGDSADRRKGFGSEALRLLLRYAFQELNLYRLGAIVPAYNQGALRLFVKAGFVEEVRRRQAVQREGRYWDLIHLGILKDEWIQSVEGK